ncbi:MAG: hypothetical protein IJ030_02680 [Oscillospiraceae bacterium]|nr:hypothetical protein [Oscillospiraceae bacterium]
MGFADHNGAGAPVFHLLHIRVRAVCEIEFSAHIVFLSAGEKPPRLGWSPQLLNKRLNTGKLTVEEWETVGKALGGTVKIRFVIDGNEVGL